MRAAALPSGRRIVEVPPALQRGRERRRRRSRSLPESWTASRIVPVVVSDGCDRPHRGGRAGGGRVRRGAADQSGRRAGAAGRLRDRAEARRRHRRHAGRRRPAPAERARRSCSHRSSRGDGRLRERVASARLLREARADPPSRCALLPRFVTILTGRASPTPRADTAPPGQTSCAARARAGPVLDERDPDRGASPPCADRRGAGHDPGARGRDHPRSPQSLRYGWNFSKVIIQTWLR